MSTADRPQSTALRAALEEARPRRIAQDALSVAEVTTRPMLEALASRLETAHAELLLGGQSMQHRSQVGLSMLEDLRRAADVVRAAARHGYPRPPLEALGAQAGHLPAARSSDPVTARQSGERTRSTPSARNHLGRLLVGFLMFEREQRGPEGVHDPCCTSHGVTMSCSRYRRTHFVEVGRCCAADRRHIDATLTSEELAHRVGLGGSEFAKRCSDLMQLGYIRVAQDTDGHDRTRRGDSGRQRLVFELTDDGRRLAEQIQH